MSTVSQRISWLKDRVKARGLIESAFSRTKVIGYSHLCTFIFTGRCGNSDLSVLCKDFEELQLKQLPTDHHNFMKVMQFTSFTNSDDVHVCVNHSAEGEVISVTLQYLGE